MNKWPPACHQLGPQGTPGRPRGSFFARQQNIEGAKPTLNLKRDAAYYFLPFDRLLLAFGLAL
jgi:hypothetical protein